MKNRNKTISAGSLLLFLLSVALLAGIAGCSRENSVQSPAGNLNFSAAGGSAFSGAMRLSTLFIQEAKVMINDLKIISGDDEDETHGEFIKVGPFVITLNLDSKVTLVTSAGVPPGTYRKVKFEIHRLQPNEPAPDPDFVDANGRYSVVVKGTFNGIGFIYKSSVTANQKITLHTPLVVPGIPVSNLTFYASPYDWFMDSGGNILDPTLPSNRLIIENNIRDNLKNHIRIFVDNDCNGQPDDGQF